MGNVIGVDGGGTKTAGVMANAEGKVIARATAGPTNPNIVSKEILLQTFEVLFKDLEAQAPKQYKHVQHLFAGVSGAGIKQSHAELVNVLTKLIPGDVTIQVEPDTVNALYSGTYGEPGIVQIAGTGSITYGINNRSEYDRVGGWGYLFGDEGSGFDIGRQGMTAVLQSDDGRGMETMLTNMFYACFDVIDARELIQEIYTASTPKDKISPLSKIVFEAYRKNDPVAVKIINKATVALSVSVLTLYRKLFDMHEPVKVVLCGGIFKEQDIVPKLIKQELNDFKQIKVHIPKMPPVGGSLIGAYIMQGLPPHKAIINNILTSLQ